MTELPMSTEFSRDRNKHVCYVIMSNLAEREINKIHEEMWGKN